jgi:hypothetical protein
MIRTSESGHLRHAKKARIFKPLLRAPAPEGFPWRTLPSGKQVGNGCFGGDGAEVKKASPTVLRTVALAIGQRVQIAHQAFEPLFDHMGVDLRGRNIGMSEQRLHDPQIRAVVQQMAGEGVAQHVR